MVALLVFLFILGILIVVHEFGHFITAKKVGVRVEKFSLGFGPKLFSKKIRETEYTVSAIPLGGYVKLAGDSIQEYTGKNDEYCAKSAGQRALIIFLGPLLNYVMGFLFFWVIFFAGYPTLTTRVGGLLDGYGAKAAGLQLGDKVIAIDDKRVKNWDDLQKMIQLKKDAEVVRIAFVRNEKEFTLDVRIREKRVDDPLGQKHSVGLLGIAPADDIINTRYGVGESFSLGAGKTWELTVLTYKALWRMVTGKLSMRESVTGPLGVFYITSKAAKLGIIPLLHIMAVLSISLAIFNLLPLPLLDGGHILLLGIEKIRGKSLGAKAEQIIARAGITFIITLAVFVTYNDIVRLFGDKIAKFFAKG